MKIVETRLTDVLVLEPKVFGDDEKLTTALLDRLADRATVIVTKGKSYRMRRRAAQAVDAADEAATKTKKR